MNNQMVWLEVKTKRCEGADGSDWTIKKTHTIKVNKNCEDLEEEAKKALKKQNKKFDEITSYKFV